MARGTVGLNAWALVWLLGCASPPAPTPPPSFVLITLDTTRADAVGAYGQTPSPTPTLDALAASGLRVAETQSVAPLTLPAHTSIMTGLTPDQHGVRDNLGYALSADPDTLAERLSAAGYDTGAFVAAVVLDATFGLDRGFDTYSDGFDLTSSAVATGGVSHWTGDVVEARAAAWLSERSDAPFFLWMHLYDAHQPYEAPADLAATWADPYLAEVAFADQQVAALLDALDRTGRRDSTIVMVIGDHGEGRGDHGERTHGQLAYRSTLHVPFVISGPGVTPGTWSGPATTPDVTATVTALAGLAPLGTGVDARTQPTGRAVYAETLYPERNLGLHRLQVLQDDRWRLIHGARDELFDWVADPGERINVAPSHPDVMARLGAALAGRVDHSASSEIRPDVAAALSQLGYLQGDGTPSETLPDPRDAPDMATAFEEAVVAARQRPPAEGAELLTAFVADYPGVAGARQMLVTAYEEAGNPDAALAALAPLIDTRPDETSLRARRAELLLTAGRTAQAEREARAVLQDAPADPGASVVLGELLRRRDACAEAIAVTTESLLHAPESSRLLLIRGACHRDLGNLADAHDDLSRAVRLDPANPDVNYVLGLVLAQRGQTGPATVALRQQLRLTPGAPLALAALGAAYYAEQDWAAAIPPLSQAVDAATDDAESRILLADALLRTGGSPPTALTLLGDAERLTPEDRRIPQIRSAAHMAAGDTAAAIRAMEATLRP